MDEPDDLYREIVIGLCGYSYGDCHKQTKITNIIIASENMAILEKENQTIETFVKNLFGAFLPFNSKGWNSVYVTFIINHKNNTRILPKTRLLSILRANQQLTLRIHTEPALVFYSDTYELVEKTLL
jgi:hypothetical protein